MYKATTDQLWKKGLRKCGTCKEIQPTTNFHNCKKAKYICKKCANRVSRSAELKTLFGLKCAKCGLTDENPRFFDLDHIKPLLRMTNGLTTASRKGLKYRENLQVLCPNCHRRKNMEERVSGIYAIVRRKPAKKQT